MSLEQERIIESDAAHLFVAASAGSGKTRVLVARYLRFVRSGHRPDQMLTITFTKKAAAEMKHRIVSALREEGLHAEAQAAETGPIQTIHSFCERLLRENAIEAGLDPLFEIVHERALALMAQECVGTAITDCIDDDDPLVEDLLLRQAGKRPYGSQDPHGELREAIDGMMQKFRSSGLSPEHLDAMAESPEVLIGHWQRTILGCLEPEIAERVSLGPNFHESLREAYGKAGRRAWHDIPPDPDAEQEDAALTCAGLRLVAAAWRRLDRLMIRTAQLDFSLLERLAVELVDRSDTVRRRLRSQFSAVFVDEGQDLNPLQYRLISSLVEQNFLIVGDVNQSIYSFRYADPELFRLHPEKYSATSYEINRNWRSAPGILSFVDEVFARKWAHYRRMAEPPGTFLLESAPSAPMDGVEVWLLSRPSSFEVAGAVRDLIDSGVRLRDLCVLVRTGKEAFRLLPELNRLEVPARIAGGNERYYTLLEVRDVANAIRALVRPSDDFALMATLRSPFVGISMDAFVLLAMPQGRPGSVIDRLRSTNLPDDDRTRVEEFLAWFEPLSSYADRLSAYEAIAELYARSPFLPNLLRRSGGRQAFANARKLLEMAAADVSLSPEVFAAQVQETASLNHRESEAEAHDDEDFVTIMTIHKAKGLEFPVVVVDGLDRRLGSRAGWAHCDPRLPMATMTTRDKRASLYSRFLQFRNELRETEEEWRTAYVALTRAKQRLCVVCRKGSRNPSIALEIPKLLRLNPEDPPEGLRVRHLGG